MNVLVVILLVILIGFLAMILATVFNAMSILSGVEYTAQYSSYGVLYHNCLNSANIYGFNSSVCSNLINVTNSTSTVLIGLGKYTGTFSDPIIWAIIFVFITAGIYVISLQDIQLGQNGAKVKTRRKRK